jgi:hypothetical protein
MLLNKLHASQDLFSCQQTHFVAFDPGCTPPHLACMQQQLRPLLPCNSATSRSTSTGSYLAIILVTATPLRAAASASASHGNIRTLLMTTWNHASYARISHTSSASMCPTQLYVLHEKWNLNMLIHMRIKIISNRDQVSDIRMSIGDSLQNGHDINGCMLGLEWDIMVTFVKTKYNEFLINVSLDVTFAHLTWLVSNGSSMQISGKLLVLWHWHSELVLLWSQGFSWNSNKTALILFLGHSTGTVNVFTIKAYVFTFHSLACEQLTTEHTLSIQHEICCHISLLCWFIKV